MTTEPMHILTPRLVLRELRESDLDAFSALYTDPLYQRFEGGALSREQARALFAKHLSQAQEDPRAAYRFAIALPPDDTLRGIIKLTDTNLSIREWEIGWGLSPAYWRNGYATEAARELMRFAFETVKAHRLVAFCRADNLASARVMEKLGMQYEGRTLPCPQPERRN